MQTLDDFRGGLALTTLDPATIPGDIDRPMYLSRWSDALV